MPSDHQLLKRFITTRCEVSFRELVDRHLNFVLSTGFRITRSYSAAEDIAQQVFCKLSARPSSVPESLPLVAWLHRTTHSFSVSFIRSEERRRKREETSVTLADMKSSNTEWESLSPVIDEALNSLGSVDRTAVLLRFYEKQSHATIGERLGLSEDSARIRGRRALDKLRNILARRGIITTIAALAAALPTHCYGTQIAPVGLANSITSTALVGSSGVGSTVLFTTAIFMKVKSFSLPVVCLALLAIPVWQQNTIAALKRERGIHAAPSELSSKTSRAVDQQHSSRKVSVATALRLAQISDPLERDVALSKWASELTTNEDILSAIQKIKEDPNSTYGLRKVIAPHLTRQWALVDPQACFNTFLEEALKKENPFKASEIRGGTSSYFGFAAITNPSGFEKWVGSTSSDQFSPLLTPNNTDPNAPKGIMSLHQDPDMAILLGLARFAPERALEVVAKNPGNEEALFILGNGSLYPSLKARYSSVDELWSLVEGLPVSQERDELFQNISRDYLSGLDRGELLDTIKNGDAGARQASELTTLGELLFSERSIVERGDEAVQNDWLDDVNALGEILNEVGRENDPAYDKVRAKMAALAVTESLEGAARWVDSITQPDDRLKAATHLALILDSNGSYDPSLITLKKSKMSKEVATHMKEADPQWAFHMQTNKTYEDFTLVSSQEKRPALTVIDSAAPVEETVKKIQEELDNWAGLSKLKDKAH